MEKDYVYHMNKDDNGSYQLKSLEMFDKLIKLTTSDSELPKDFRIDFMNHLSLIPAFNLTEFMLSNY